MARTRQPQGPARIDWSNPLTRGLVDAFSFSGTTRSVIVGANVATNTNAGLVATEKGIAQRFSASGRLQFTNADQHQLTGTMTAAVFAKQSADTGYLIAKMGDVGDTASPFYFLLIAGSPYLGRAGSGALNYRQWQTATVAPSGWSLLSFSAPALIESTPTMYVNGVACATPTLAAGSGTGTATAAANGLIFGARPDGVLPATADIVVAYLWNRELSPAEHALIAKNPWQLFAPPRRLWIQLGAASGGAGTDAAIAGTQDSDVGAITAEATTAAAIAGTQDADVGAIAAEATTGAAIAGAQAPDVGAITAEATTGAAIVGTQDSDVAALEVTAGTGSTDAAMAGTQAPDVGAITVEATLGLTLSATQASDVGYIVVEATLPASMAGTQDSDVAAITVTAAGTSIWTDISGSTTSWADQSAASTIWTDL